MQKRSKKLTPKSIKRKLAVFKHKTDEAKKTIQPDLLEFLFALGMEGERSAVVLGAERINVALETLLKKFLRPSPNTNDTLFASDGALATFSRKIEVAYRLGLIDPRFKQALNSIRKLRNDFAHATKVERLQEQSHADRVKALWTLVEKSNESKLEGFVLAFQESGEQAAQYLSCVMLLLLKLELVRHHLERPYILLPAKLNYREKDSD